MAQRMAAVLRAPGKLCSFFVCFICFFVYVLDVVSITVYDRDTLLNIGSSVAQRKPDFEFLNAGGLFRDTASEPFVWVAQLRKRRRRRKRGKRAGVLVRLRRRAFRPPLPTRGGKSTKIFYSSKSTITFVVNSVLLKCRKLRRKDQETSDSIVGFFIEKPQL